jgi:acetoin utilization protein AcuB
VRSAPKETTELRSANEAGPTEEELALALRSQANSGEALGMHADRLMRLEVVTVPPELQLEAAHKLMLRREVRHLPVVSGRRLAGILSDRDILLASGRLKNGTFVYPNLTVGEVMSLSPISADPSTPLSEIAKSMVQSKIDCLPIITGQNELVGLVTSTDLMLVLTGLPAEAQPALSFQIRRAGDLETKA